jgi:tagatose-1,6-bisphosphate aldolase non-catalytic subunit AgaZ/GatZ
MRLEHVPTAFQQTASQRYYATLNEYFSKAAEQVVVERLFRFTAVKLFFTKMMETTLVYSSYMQGRTATPFACKYSFTSRMRYWPKWKMEAASAASAPPMVKPS